MGTVVCLLCCCCLLFFKDTKMHTKCKILFPGGATKAHPQTVFIYLTVYCVLVRKLYFGNTVNPCTFSSHAEQ